LTNLLSFLDEVTQRLDEGKSVEVCYVDFSKAFESVSHSFLLYKLDLLGITNRIRLWVESFLTDRTYVVKVGSEASNQTWACSGLPQGSILGPLLFLVYIDDLLRSIRCPTFAFADDVKITTSAGRTALAEDVERVAQWADKWDLPLNFHKCHLLTQGGGDMQVEIEGKDIAINAVSKVKDLGVMVSSDFKWATQCRAASQKARNELFRLRSALTCRAPEVFLPLYQAFVRPHLEYCVQAWAPYFKKDIACIEGVQRLATRMIPGLRGRSYEERLDILNLFSMERRRLRGDLIETFKLLKGLNKIDGDLFKLLPESRTRGHHLKVAKPRSKLQLRVNFFSNRVINAWNKLPDSKVQAQSVASFKRALDRSWESLFNSR